MLRLNVEQYAVAARWEVIAGSADPAQLARSASEPRFPGALLPAVDSEGKIYWYAVANSGAEWRLLQPLLLAFAGPTVTTFRGQPDDLTEPNPAEDVLRRAGATIGARLVPGEGCSLLVERALARLVQGVLARPRSSETEFVTTGRLIARFEMALVAGDRGAAESALTTLRSEMRVDALNVHFLEVRLLSTFREWRELSSKAWFSDLAFARKPSVVASAMVDAIWYAELQPFENDESALRTRYFEGARRVLVPLIAQVSPGQSAIADRLRGLDGSSRQPSLEPGAAAQTALASAVEAPSVLRMVRATDAIAELRPSDRATVLESGSGSAAVAELEALGPLAPSSWREWLHALSRAEFANCITAARDLVTEAPATQIASSVEAAPIADAIVQVAVEENAARERLTECIPLIMRWLKDDPEYPRRVLKAIYDAIFQLFTLIEHRGPPERDAAADLLDAILKVGSTRKEYTQLIRDLRLLVDPGAGISSVYWLIDLAAILLEHPAPDSDARLEFLSTALASFQSILRLLTPGQRAAYNRVAEGAGWPTLPAPIDAQQKNPFAALRGKSVAIYTLTESAGRQAEQTLRQLEPSLRVELAHDHVASPQLVRLARTADIFVVAAASAKHAATDCITASRGDRQLRYAPGRGFSGIIRVIEQYALELSQAETMH